MNTPFRAGNTITQNFGERADYYKQFGLAGHEGLDCVPVDGERAICAVEDGIVVRDVDDPKSGAYGIYCVVLNKQTKRAWWYCHMSQNNTSIGQEIKRGDVLGTMGGTGNVTGDHLHLGIRYADENGNATNIDNGYKGFVDPAPVLNNLNKTAPVEQEVLVPAKTYEMLVNKASKWDDTIKYLEFAQDRIVINDISFGNVKQKVDGLRQELEKCKSEATLTIQKPPGSSGTLTYTVTTDPKNEKTASTLVDLTPQKSQKTLAERFIDFLTYLLRKQ